VRETTGFEIVIAGEVLQHRQREGHGLSCAGRHLGDEGGNSRPALAMPGAPDYIQYDVPEVAADVANHVRKPGSVLR
jgi:hypothetical protein